MRLALCEWMRRHRQALGGTEDDRQLVLRGGAEEWELSISEIQRIFEQKEKWEKQCADRGVSATGLMREQSHLPVHLRKSRRFEFLVPFGQRFL